MTTRTHIQTLLTTISQGLYEKEHILALALLCAISGESCFLLGPPGTAKSEIARRLKLIFKDASAFEYLMSRFSTPNEIFGPVSIQKLKSEDTYERKVDGFLPSATVVFLDEIWKAGPAIQNALLTVINERIYRNGTNTLQLPMKCLIAASNELPAEDEGLEALWDRFLVRIVSNCIADEKTFYRMLQMQQMPQITVPTDLLITEQRYAQWQQGFSTIIIPENILSAVTAVRQRLKEATKGENVEPLDYYISDRRWRKIFHLLRASAYLNGRMAIDHSDLVLLIHTLWNKVETIEQVLSIVSQSIFADLEPQIATIEKTCESANKTPASNPAVETESYKVFELFYLGLDHFPEGKCFFSLTDYKYIPNQGEANGMLYYDERMNAHVIRHYDKSLKAFDTSGKQKVTMVKLRKFNGCLIVDGSPYPFIKKSSNAPSSEIEMNFNEPNHLLTSIDALKQSLLQRFNDIRSSQNIFVAPEDIRLLQRQYKALDKRLDIARVKAANV